LGIEVGQLRIEFGQLGIELDAGVKTMRSCCGEWVHVLCFGFGQLQPGVDEALLLRWGEGVALQHATTYCNAL